MSAIVLRGDAARLPLPDGCVDLIMCSPPYFGLRSYSDGGTHYDGQIGSEATPREYLDALLACTAEWVRVLKPEGSLFVNLGDKYAGSSTSGPPSPSSTLLGNGHRGGGPKIHNMPAFERQPVRSDAPPKSLLGLPWRYAIACMDQLGLILRRDIVWHKPNGLPESVTDRCRSSHEYLFHMVKRPRYYAAVDEIREDYLKTAPYTAHRFNGANKGAQSGGYPTELTPFRPNPLGKLPGSVWTIPSAPLTVPDHLGVDHFAAYPPELVRRVVLGWSPPGVCTACGEGRRPVTSAVALDMSRPQARRAQWLADEAGLTEAHLNALVSVGISDTGRGAATQNGTGKNTARVYELANEARAALGGYAREYLLRRPSGFTYACACPAPDAPTRPAVVLDPFAGTGTTMLVASAYGRTGIGVDRSADYCRLARWRCSDPGERARAMNVPKPPPVPDGQGSLFDDLEAS